MNGRTPGSTSAPWTVSRAPGRGAHRWRAPVPARASSLARLATVRSAGVPRGARAPLREARAETEAGLCRQPLSVCRALPSLPVSPRPAASPGHHRWVLPAGSLAPGLPQRCQLRRPQPPEVSVPALQGPPSSRGCGMTASTPCPGLTPSTARPSLGAPAAPWAPPPSSEVSVSHCVLSVPSPREELFP